MIDSSIGYLPPEAAVDFLCSADPLVYYVALDRLLRHASRGQTHILGAYCAEPHRLRSLLLDFPVCSEPAEFTSDWFLVAHSPLDASQLIAVLPLRGQALLYMYSQDEGLLAAIRPHRRLEFIGSQSHLLFRDELKEHRGRSGHPVVRLTDHRIVR